jgi:hypothetical protein
MLLEWAGRHYRTGIFCKASCCCGLFRHGMSANAWAFSRRRVRRPGRCCGQLYMCVFPSCPKCCCGCRCSVRGIGVACNVTQRECCHRLHQAALSCPASLVPYCLCVSDCLVNVVLPAILLPAAGQVGRHCWPRAESSHCRRQFGPSLCGPAGGLYTGAL